MASGNRPGPTLKRGHELEAKFDALLREGFAPVEQAVDAAYDFRTVDGRWVIEVKHTLLSARDFYEVLLKLVFVLDEHREIEHGVLIAHLPRMSEERLRYEWDRLQKTLRPSVAERLGLVAVAADGALALPSEPNLYRLLAIAQQVFREEQASSESQSITRKWSAKTFEVWKVLLAAWLRSEGLLPIGEIAKRSGCSRPTVDAVLELLQSKGELVRGQNRSAGLAHLPRESLREALVLANELRLTRRFVDASGRRPDPLGLVRRLNEQKPNGVAFGGVVAARHYQPNFDLNGLPRVDVTVEREQSLISLTAVDPALRPVSSDERAPILVVHRSFRLDQFEAAPKSVLPFADPAEVLLDLYDLRLTEQAEEFVRAMRAQGGARV